MKYWKPDNDIYIKLQELQKFADFINELPITIGEDKTTIKEIKFLIKNCDNNKFDKSWNLCLDIFDNEVQSRLKEGVYWRKWNVCFENGLLEIDAETEHSKQLYGHYGTDYSYYSSINFNVDFKGNRVEIAKDISGFINDVKNYRNYIKGTLNNLEIDVSIW